MTQYAALVRLTKMTLHHVQVQTEFSILSMGQDPRSDLAAYYPQSDNARVSARHEDL